MGRVKLIHSFSTRPLFINTYQVPSSTRIVGNIIYYALSVAYALRSGAEIELHTDTLGSRLLGDIPYNDVHLTLDSLPSDLCPRFWAAGKMWALEASGPGVIHIDGDVFLKKSSLLDKISETPWDFVCQNYESGDWYKSEIGVYKKHQNLLNEIGLKLESWGGYNTGVMGFRDPELQKRFIDGYKKLAITIGRSERDILMANSKLTPDLIAEQQWIYQVTKGKKVYKILGDLKEAEGLGYQHVLTSSKFDNLRKPLEILEKVSPEIYHKIEKLCQSVLQR